MAPKDCQQIPSSVTVALQCLKSLMTSPFTKDPSCSADWVKLLQSTLATVIDYAKPGECDFETAPRHLTLHLNCSETTPYYKPVMHQNHYPDSSIFPTRLRQG